MSSAGGDKRKQRKVASKSSRTRDAATLVAATLAGILATRTTDAADSAEQPDGLQHVLQDADELAASPELAASHGEQDGPGQDAVASIETEVLAAELDARSLTDAELAAQAQAAAEAEADPHISAQDEVLAEAEAEAESSAAAEVRPDAQSAADGSEQAGQAGSSATTGNEMASADGAAPDAGASSGSSSATGAGGAGAAAAPAVGSGVLAGLTALPLAAAAGGGGGGGGASSSGTAPLNLTTGTVNNTGPGTPQAAAYTIAQVMAMEPVPAEQSFVIADTSANLFAKMGQSHAATFFGRADGVVATDAATLAQALVLAGFDTSFTDTELAESGALSVAWSDVILLQTAGLKFGGNADVTLVLPSELLDDAIGNSPALHMLGIHHFDIDGTQATITQGDAAAMLQAGIDFVAGDHVTMEVAGTQLQTSLDDLQALGVDVIGGPHGGAPAQGSPLHVSLAASGAGALPQIDPAFHASLHLQAGQLSQAIASAQHLHDAGIDQFSSDTLVSLSASDASSLIDAGISFATADTVQLHVAGTALQSSLDDLQDLGVDQVSSGVPSVLVQQGVEVNTGTQVAVFDQALDVTLQVTPAQVDSVLVQPATVSASQIDHLSIGTGAAGNLSDKDGSTLLAALQAAGIDDIRIAPLATVTVTDDQAARLLLAGKLTVDANADLTIRHAPTGSDPEPGKLDVTLAQLAQIGADHVDTLVGGSVMVDVGVAVADINVNQELQALLGHFTDGAPLFGEADVTLSIGAVNINQITSGIAAELKLLGVDHLLGQDGDGNPLTRDLV
jgi:hypothetical protein